MHHYSGPFTIPDIRNIIPEKVKPFILLVFFLIYQLSGGVYMAAVSEMKGSLALMQEDIMMAGFASLVGLALTFTLMFRLKFRFPLKNSLIVSSVALILCNLISIHTHSVMVLVTSAFVSGFFRMWGTFACNSTIQLWVTPKRDMAVWFSYICLFVQGYIELSGLTSIYVAFLSSWQYMHWMIVTLHLCLILFTWIFFRHYRSMPKLPLFGIDWMGMALWATTLLSAIFVLNYGEHYDWLDSVYIRAGLIIGIVSLALNLWRASFIRHPFIALKTWTFRNVWLTAVLYIVINLLISPSHFFEHLYAEAILGYDSLNVISLNWAVMLGIICGAAFMYQFFALRKWTYKTTTLIGFALIVAYLMVMYFIIDFNLPKQTLMIPLFIRGFGYIILAITLITALTTIPFHSFPQTLTIQGFFSACLGSLIGGAFLEHFFKIIMTKNMMLLSIGLDRVNQHMQQIPLSQIAEGLQKQAMMVSLKEIYGWLSIAGMLCMLAFLLHRSTLRPSTFHPKFHTIRKSIKHELKMDKTQAPE